MLIKDPRYNNPHPIRLEVGRYAENGNIALRGIVVDPENGEEPWCTFTVNMGENLPDDRVCLKTWSENLGVEQVLLEANIIEFEACDILINEFVDAPVYMLTEHAKREFGLF